MRTHSFSVHIARQSYVHSFLDPRRALQLNRQDYLDDLHELLLMHLSSEGRRLFHCCKPHLKSRIGCFSAYIARIQFKTQLAVL